MSTPSTTTPAPAAWGPRIAKVAATAVVAVALVFGANAVTKSGASSSSAAPGGTAGQPPNGARFGGPPMGADVTGATLSKLESVVAAKYPGTVEHAMKLPDGSYAVHVLRSSGEVHVLVSKDFKITGTQAGGPPPPAA